MAKPTSLEALPGFAQKRLHSSDVEPAADLIRPHHGEVLAGGR